MMKEKTKIILKTTKMPTLNSPGTAGIPNFWLKQLDVPHNHYARAFNKLIQEEEVMKEWLTEGNTFLIPKSEKKTPTTSSIDQ